MWRCIVCGYLCARKEPPAVCPICKAKKDRFEEFGHIVKTETESCSENGKECSSG